MQLDLEKVIESYGGEALTLIEEDMDYVVFNMKYLMELGFTDVEDIFERYTLLFTDNPKIFQDKINGLAEIFGESYIKVIENDLSVLEELL